MPRTFPFEDSIAPPPGDPAPDPRFSGLARLLGPQALAPLGRAHVCVVGIGGVGSWTTEALARSGVGRLTLVDFDAVCATNINRQIHALENTIGTPKVEVMAARLRSINPQAQIETLPVRFTAQNARSILAARYTCVVDAIDHTADKCHLIAGCRERDLPVVVSGGAGGRTDPTRIRVADLAFTSHDPLLTQVRARLRHEHGFPSGRAAFGVPCVYSTEQPVRLPVEISPVRGFGTAAYVTGTFGFVLASLAVGAVVSPG